MIKAWSLIRNGEDQAVIFRLKAYFYKFLRIIFVTVVDGIVYRLGYSNEHIAIGILAHIIHLAHILDQAFHQPETLDIRVDLQGLIFGRYHYLFRLLK